MAITMHQRKESIVESAKGFTIDLGPYDEVVCGRFVVAAVVRHVTMINAQVASDVTSLSKKICRGEKPGKIRRAVPSVGNATNCPDIVVVTCPAILNCLR
jgi:hypothetical protein